MKVTITMRTILLVVFIMLLWAVFHKGIGVNVNGKQYSFKVDMFYKPVFGK